jgi:hypothetical protein
MADYLNIEGLETIDSLWLNRAEDASAGLSPDEVLVMLATPRSRLNPVELEWFNTACATGRAKAKKIAVDNLFSSMRDKGGQQASLAYLVRFADGWTEEGSGIAPGGNFTFTVNKK